MAVNRTDLGEALREAMTPKTTEEAVETESVEAETVETEDVEDAVEAEATEDVTTEETEPAEEIETFTQLAKQIEVEPEFIYGLKVPIDGEEKLTMGELKDKYLLLKNGSSVESDVLKTERAAFETYKVESEQNIQKQMSLPQEILAAQAKVLSIKSQYETFDWETLEKENPGEAALYKQNINQAYTQAQTEAQQAIGQYSQAREAELEKVRTDEYTHMLKAIPEWTDNTVKTKDQEAIRPVLMDYGYSEAEIDGIADHRAMRMARDLMMFKATTVKAKETLKKVVTIPKKYRSGKLPEQTGVSKAERLERASKLHSPRDKAKEIGKLLRGE